MNLRERLSKNKLNVKLISLVMAIFLWSYVMGVVNPEKHIDYRGIEVQFTGTDYIQREGLSVLSPKNPKTNVRVEGTISDLSSISSSSNTILAEANLSGVRPGENIVNVSVTIKENTGRIRIVDVEPSQIVVNIDEIVTENLEVTVSPLGDLPEGYTLGNVKVVDNYVRVTAPKSTIGQIEKVVAFPVITDKTDTFMINSPIVFLDKNDNEIQNLTVSSEFADIEIPIYKLKSVPIRPNIVGTIGTDEKITNIKVAPESVVIRGSTEVVDKIAHIDTEQINLQDLVGSQTFDVDLNLPEGISLHDSNLEVKLEYEYINNIQKTITVTKDNFYINNKNSNLEYTINSEFDAIDIILYGESSILEDLTSENVKVYIDVKGLSPGEYALETNIESIDDVTLKGIDPDSIEIVIADKADPEANTQAEESPTQPEDNSNDNNN